MSTGDINVTPTPASGLTEDRIKQLLDGTANFAIMVAAMTPFPQDDVVASSLKMVLDQDWFAQLIFKMINTPHAQRVAMAASPAEAIG